MSVWSLVEVDAFRYTDGMFLPGQPVQGRLGIVCWSSFPLPEVVCPLQQPTHH